MARRVTELGIGEPVTLTCAQVPGEIQAVYAGSEAHTIRPQAAPEEGARARRTTVLFAHPHPREGVVWSARFDTRAGPINVRVEPENNYRMFDANEREIIIQ